MSIVRHGPVTIILGVLLAIPMKVVLAKVEAQVQVEKVLEALWSCIRMTQVD